MDTVHPGPQHTPIQRRSRIIDRSPIYYGWIVLAAGTLGIIMTTPGQTLGVSVFLDAMIADLGLSRSGVSLLYTAGTLAGALIVPFVGRWIDRCGPRVAVTVISALFALACAGMGLVTGPVSLLLGFTAIRSLGQGALGLVSQYVINLWFVRRRGFAIGLSGIGMALAGAVFPLGIQALMTNYDWRVAYALLGAIVALTILPVGALLFRERPEMFGLLPDGPDRTGERTPPEEAEYTLAQARRTAIFWLFLASGFLTGALGTGLVFHHFSIMAANGLSRTAAAAIFTPIAFLAAAGNLLTGLLLDRIEPRRLLPIALGLLAGALLMAPWVVGAPLAWLYGGIVGGMQGMQSAIGAAAWPHYFGRANAGAIRGIAFTSSVVGAAVGPLPFAWGFESFGSYTAVLMALATMPLAAALASFFVRPSGPPGPRR